MQYWREREELSLSNRLRRSYYEILRDDLEQHLIRFGLLDSYENFMERGQPYPFVEKRELKPRAILPDIEYECQNSFLVIFVEDTIPQIHKKYIRFFDVNRTTKTNLLRSKTLPLSLDEFDRKQKYLDSARFTEFLKALLPVDYALLIQRDPTVKGRFRYGLSHFHVRVDWPIADAAEDMARELRYISKDLYEKGDKYAEDVQKKFFEYYGLPSMVGGRRTAACVAAQYFRRIPCITSVYAGSSETRALIRLSEQGVSKTVLMRLSPQELDHLAEVSDMYQRTFRKNYVLDSEEEGSVCIFQVSYSRTEQSRPPEDGKLRELKPDLYWLTVHTQQFLPLPGVWQHPPLPFNVIYS